MSQLCRRIARPVSSIIKWNSLLDTVSSFRRFFRSIWDRISISSSSASCFSGFVVINRRHHHLSRNNYGSRRSSNVNSGGSNSTSNGEIVKNSSTGQYRRLQGSLGWRLRRRRTQPSLPAVEEEEEGELVVGCLESVRSELDSDSDLVPLKISCLGDCHIGKTSFVVKYVGDEQERNSLQLRGLNLMDKTLVVRGARIAFSIWDVGGDRSSLDHLPIACKDAVAILFMFDLTSRCTLQNVMGWYGQARKWNQTAIPVLIGTKFDDFVRLPPDLQWTIMTQARAYARAMKATLFFSSATHNINVNKIFKFITAKLFNLPWTPQRNLTVGEPTIDFF